MRCYILALYILCLLTHAQIPSLSYDTMYVEHTDQLHRKTFLMGNAVVKQVTYPTSKGSMKSYCYDYGYDYAYDSIHVYYSAPKVVEVIFDSLEKRICTWVGSTVNMQEYNAQNKLVSDATHMLLPNFFSDRPKHCGFIHDRMGTYIMFDENGDTSDYANYNEGKYIYLIDGQKVYLSYSSAPLYVALEKKAHELLRKNYGDVFFDNYIQKNLSGTTFKWNEDQLNTPEHSALMRKGIIPDKAINEIHFAFFITLTDHEPVDAIYIELDAQGTVLDSKGLLEKTPRKEALSRNEALLQAKKAGLLKGTAQRYYEGIVWKETHLSGRGTLYHQFLYNRVEKPKNKLLMDQVLVNVFDKKELKEEQLREFIPEPNDE